MPISLSAKKSLRVAQTKTIQNRSRKRRIHQLLKTVSQENITEAISIVDKAVKWGLWHKNKAARVKSRLAKQFLTTKPQPSKKPPIKKLGRPKTIKASPGVAKAKKLAVKTTVVKAKPAVKTTPQTKKPAKK
ncbi:MAG: 30S ribosomal protein S20 [Patescibacteria group bacterium]